MTKRWIAGAEVAVVFLAILAYIWWVRFVFRWAWVAILLGVLGSHVARREGPWGLGFRPRAFPGSLRRYGPWLGGLALGLLALGGIFRSYRNVTLEFGAGGFAMYCAWGLFQQYLLNGFFVNRLEECWPGSGARTVPAVAAVLFSAAHFPNWFLMLATLAGGYFCARIYRERRDLFFLGLAHAIVGFLLYFVVPDSIIRHLYVGPHWFQARP